MLGWEDGWSWLRNIIQPGGVARAELCLVMSKNKTKPGEREPAAGREKNKIKLINSS